MMQNIVCCSCWFFLISVPGSCLLVAQVPGSAAALLVAAFTSYICLQTEARNSLRLLNQAPTYHFRGVTIRRSSADLRFISSRVVTFHKIWILQTETWGKIKLYFQCNSIFILNRYGKSKYLLFSELQLAF